jgi:outer membrane protein OmpA-like peptidoglycan-associated protein
MIIPQTKKSLSLFMRFFFIIGFLMLSKLSIAQTIVKDEIRKSIYFGGGSYYVTEEQITELYHWLDSIPGVNEKYAIQLISHTDPIGGKEFNEWLSKMRSEAVQQVLINKNISEHKITIKDWAYDNPVYSNTTYNGMQLNRRVDVILYPIVF